MRCKCGEKMAPTTLREVDLAPFAGLPAAVHGMHALRCAKCGEELLIGKEIDRALAAVAVAVLNREGRLTAPEARLLRQQLGLTQRELAGRMGLHTITVAGWESKKPISPQHDHILRAMVLAKLAPAVTPEQMRSVLDHVRTAGPPKTPRRLVVEGLAS